jgi:predicted Rossmann fold nucleotide-binding protein DprA/Smf involved in DNA uptake
MNRQRTPVVQRDELKTLVGYLKQGQRVHIDSVIETSGMNAQTVLGMLLELELQGIVTQHPGKLFSLAMT